MKKIERIFKFRPFSQKQRMVLNWWCKDSPVKDSDGIIADGAIRSGKTVSMSLSFIMWAMSYLMVRILPCVVKQSALSEEMYYLV